MAVDSSTTVFKADITNFRQAMQEAARAVRLANSEFKEATAGMDKWANSTDGLQAKCKQLNTTLDAQKRQLDILQTEYNKVAKEEGESSKGAQELEIKINNQKAAIKNTESELNKYTKELDDAGKENNELADDVEKTNSAMEKANEGFTVAKAVLANLVAEGIRMAVQGLKDLATEAFNVGASFESAMSKVQAVSGANAEEIQALTDKAKQMGETTIFSATQSAEAFNYMAMAGWKTGDMLNGIEGIMNLAAASGEDLASVSDIVTDALTAFGLEAKDSSHFADVLAAASSNANTNVSMMGETFKYAAPIAGALGYSIEDTAVAIGLMANAGIKSSQAGTALRKILTQLNGDVKVSGKNFGELTIQTSNADGSMRPLADILKDLRSAFDQMTDSEKAANAETIAGKTAMSGLLAMVNASEKDFNKLTTAIDGSTGAAEKMAKTMTDNVNGQLTLLQSNIEGKMIKVFEQAAPEIKKAINEISTALNNMDWDGIAQGVGAFVKTIGDLFSFILKNGGSIIDVLKTIATVMATVFVVNKLGAFVGMINSMVAAYGSLGAVLAVVKSSQLALNAAQLASPIGAILVTVGAVTAGYIALRNAQDEAAKAEYGMTDVERELKTAIDATYDSQKQVIDTREKNIEAITGEYNRINELKDEYNSLIGVNGEVKEGYEARANFIITELANALGMEKSEVQELIGVNGQLSTSIDEIIQKKQIEATLGAYEDSYKQAKANEAENLKNLVEVQNAYSEAKEKASKIGQEYAEVAEMVQGITERGGQVTGELGDRYYSLAKSYEEAENRANELGNALNEQNTVFDNNATTIQNYEGLKTAALENDAAEMDRWLDNLTHNYKDATSMTQEELDKQVRAMEEYVSSMERAQANGNSRITDEAINAARDRLNKLQAEYQKATQAATTEATNTGNTYAQKIGEAVGATQKSATTIREAVEQNIKSKEAGNIGTNTVTEYSQGITAAAGEANAAAETVALNANEGFNSADFNSTGYNISLGVAAGIRAGQNEAVQAAIDVVTAAINAANKTGEIESPSKVTMETGYYLSAGIAVGLVNGAKAVKKAAKKLVETVIYTTDEGFKFALSDKSASSFTLKLVEDISKQESKLVKLTKNMVKTVITELKKLKNFNFDDVADNASKAIDNTMQNRIQYLLDRATYKNNKKIAEYDTAISDLEKLRDKDVKAAEKARDKAISDAETKRDKAIAKAEKNRDAAIKKIEEERDKKLNALDPDPSESSAAKKKIKAEADAKIKAEKEAAEKTIKNAKSTAEKTIKNSKKNATTEINNIKSNYKSLIATQKKYKEAYSTASKEMLEGLQTALSEYEQAANELINNTITGITEKYNAKYDKLMQKQESLISKLKESTKLFEVSGAGIMTVNDINKQTQQITDYTNKLAKIKAQVSSDLFDEIASYDMKEGSAFIDRLLAMSEKDLKAYDTAYTKHMELIESKSESIYKSDFDKIAKDYKSEIDKAFKNLPAQLEKLGKQAMQGFVNGLTKNTDYMDENVKTFVNQLIKQFKKDLKISSPSKVMFGLGEYTGEGFGDGMLSIKDYILKVASIISAAASSPLTDLSTDLRGFKSSVNGALSVPGAVNAGNVVNNYNLVQNNTSPKALTALETYQARRQQIALVKAFAPS